MKKLVLAALAVVCSVPVFADEADIGLNADAVRFQYVRPLQRNSLQVDAGWLHNSDVGDVLHIGASLAGFASDGVNPVKGGLGARLLFADGELSNQSGLNLALGGFMHYTFPRYNRLSLHGSAYYAPDVVSTGDAETFRDYALKLSYNLLQEADVYLGARYVRGDYEDAPDARFDTGLHAGLNIRF